MQEKRKQWKTELKNIDISKLVFLDESSINLAYFRLYGRAKKNQRIRQGIKDCRFQRQSVLSTVSFDGQQIPFVFDGTLNKELFAEYLKTQLAPSFASDRILVLDNSSVHKSKKVIATLESLNIKYLFLPPYSPDYNPIELLWSKMKTILRKLKARNKPHLEIAIRNALASMPLSNIHNWYRHCGYTTDKS